MIQSKIFTGLIFLFSLCFAAMADNKEQQWQEIELKTMVKQQDGTQKKYSLEIKCNAGVFRQIELEYQEREWNMGQAQLQMLQGCSVNSLKIYSDPKTGIRFTLKNPKTGKTFSCTPALTGIDCVPIEKPEKSQKKHQKNSKKELRTDNGKTNTDKGLSPAAE